MSLIKTQTPKNILERRKERVHLLKEASLRSLDEITNSLSDLTAEVMKITKTK